MDILKFATDWAKAEVFSSKFFILAGVLFLLASAGFWQLGKTEFAKAYIVPTLVAGILILAVGTGIFYANKTRVTSFVEAYNKDSVEFVKSEIERTEKSLNEYRTIVFKVIPFIILIASMLIVLLNQPGWRAACITIIAMMIVIMLVDSNANARLQEYRAQLDQVIE